MSGEMSPDEAYEFYAEPEHHTGSGPPIRRRKGQLSKPIPVRPTPTTPPEKADTVDRTTDCR